MEGSILGAYHNNDFFVQGLTDFQLVNPSARIGLTPLRKRDVSGEQDKLLLQAYVLGTVIKDTRSDVWNKVDWHNNAVYGIGGRLKIFPDIPKLWFLDKRDMNLEFFVEGSKIRYFKNEFFFTEHRPTSDLKAGFQFYMSFDNSRLCSDRPDSSPFLYAWTGLAGGAFYSRNSFYNVGQTGFYLSSLNAMLGIGMKLSRKAPMELYLTHRSIIDLGGKAWNRLDWYNRFIYGMGIRFRYFNPCHFKMGEWNLRAFPYLEFLQVRYIDRGRYVPSYRPRSDIQGGISIWLSFLSRY
ncbi:MAG: hypothetical protein J5I94_05035 [Phaeodactylibacter sp.]|nr:hypothetical protein [Phaeodactylibacter sp.]